MFEKCWSRLKNNFGLLVGMSFLTSVMSTVLVFITGNDISGVLITNVASIILSTIMIKAYLEATCHSEKVTIDDIFSSIVPSVGRVIGINLILSLLIAVITVIGAFVGAFAISGFGSIEDITEAFLAILILVVVLSILLLILSLFLVFTNYAAVDDSLEGLSVFERLKFAIKLTKGHKLEIVGCMFLNAVLSIVGVLMLFVGTLITTPLSGLIMASLYVKVRDNYLSKGNAGSIESNNEIESNNDIQLNEQY